MNEGLLFSRTRPHLPLRLWARRCNQSPWCHRRTHRSCNTHHIRLVPSVSVPRMHTSALFCAVRFSPEHATQAKHLPTLRRRKTYHPPSPYWHWSSVKIQLQVSQFHTAWHCSLAYSPFSDNTTSPEPAYRLSLSLRTLTTRQIPERQPTRVYVP